MTKDEIKAQAKRNVRDMTQGMREFDEKMQSMSMFRCSSEESSDCAVVWKNDQYTVTGTLTKLSPDADISRVERGGHVKGHAFFHVSVVRAQRLDEGPTLDVMCTQAQNLVHGEGNWVVAGLGEFTARLAHIAPLKPGESRERVTVDFDLRNFKGAGELLFQQKRAYKPVIQLGEDKNAAGDLRRYYPNSDTQSAFSMWQFLKGQQHASSTSWRNTQFEVFAELVHLDKEVAKYRMVVVHRKDGKNWRETAVIHEDVAVLVDDVRDLRKGPQTLVIEGIGAVTATLHGPLWDRGNAVCANIQLVVRDSQAKLLVDQTRWYDPLVKLSAQNAKESAKKLEHKAMEPPLPQGLSRGWTWESEWGQLGVRLVSSDKGKYVLCASLFTGISIRRTEWTGVLLDQVKSINMERHTVKWEVKYPDSNEVMLSIKATRIGELADNPCVTVVVHHYDKNGEPREVLSDQRTYSVDGLISTLPGTVGLDDKAYKEKHRRKVFDKSKGHYVALSEKHIIAVLDALEREKNNWIGDVYCDVLTHHPEVYTRLEGYKQNMEGVAFVRYHTAKKGRKPFNVAVFPEYAEYATVDIELADRMDWIRAAVALAHRSNSRSSEITGNDAEFFAGEVWCATPHKGVIRRTLTFAPARDEAEAMTAKFVEAVKENRAGIVAGEYLPSDQFIAADPQLGRGSAYYEAFFHLYPPPQENMTEKNTLPKVWSKAHEKWNVQVYVISANSTSVRINVAAMHEDGYTYSESVEIGALNKELEARRELVSLGGESIEWDVIYDSSTDHSATFRFQLYGDNSLIEEAQLDLRTIVNQRTLPLAADVTHASAATSFDWHLLPSDSTLDIRTGKPLPSLRPLPTHEKAMTTETPIETRKSPLHYAGTSVKDAYQNALKAQAAAAVMEGLYDGLVEALRTKGINVSSFEEPVVKAAMMTALPALIIMASEYKPDIPHFDKLAEAAEYALDKAAMSTVGAAFEMALPLIGVISKAAITTATDAAHKAGQAVATSSLAVELAARQEVAEAVRETKKQSKKAKRLLKEVQEREDEAEQEAVSGMPSVVPITRTRTVGA